VRCTSWAASRCSLPTPPQGGPVEHRRYFPRHEQRVLDGCGRSAWWRTTISMRVKTSPALLIFWTGRGLQT
jgi:hypothetical protein